MSKIKHMVTFSLLAGKDNDESETFLRMSREELSAIPGVEQFEVFRQVSPKNEYDYGFSMVFADQKAYDAYNEHPVHISYVEEQWKTKVSQFQEIDLVLL
ncbi:Dabb family protein [Paenibacillus lemnae]|uniref:Dabb family protein n=1 Tax=Paenibacillus lemnae TaxID=1330551 RepID=UPI001FE6A6B9|nr:Dabb family protein [Paenibacillus lemnae]